MLSPTLSAKLSRRLLIPLGVAMVVVAPRCPVSAADGEPAQAIAAVAATPARQSDTATYTKHVLPFLQQHCTACHGPKQAKAGLRIDQLGTDFQQGRTADLWKEVIDAINLGEMPPEEKPRPDAKQAFAVVEWVGRQLKRAEREARMAGGRILMRRLNRREYAYTVGDLLKLDPNFIAKLLEELPADGKAEGFDRISTALFFDQTQLQKYLAIADMIAAEAIRDAPPKAESYTWEAEAYRRNEGDQIRSSWPARKTVKTGPTYFDIRKGQGVEMWGGQNGKGQTLVRIPAGPKPGFTKLVTQDGYYRVRIKAGAFPGDRGEPIRLRLTYARNTPLEFDHVVEVKGTMDEPAVTEFVVFLRAGQPDQKKGFDLMWNGLADIRLQNPNWNQLNLRWLRMQGARGRAAAARDEALLAKLAKEREQIIADMVAFAEPKYLPNPKHDLKTVPRFWLDSVSVEGPIARQWPPASHKVLGIVDGVPESEAEVRAFFTRLLPRAYRRPPASHEIETLVRVVAQARQAHGMTPSDALRLGFKAMLCSPGFVFIQEPTASSQADAADATPKPSSLNGHELASRLSYFLWSSMPDAELSSLAENGKLKDPAALRAQVTRMLADARSRRLVEGFAGQWLSVDQFGSVMPAREYADYDKALETASAEEPLAFFEHVLRKDLPITRFIDSDFLVINERLARHYGIDGVQGDGFRAVAIRPEHHRGGVLGMAGLLTWLSDGTRTLPVRRASWVLETLLNDPPAPPPPNAGEIQPNTRGKKLTVRERLTLHRNEPTCASCHAKLDGYGLALENYDAIGAWRQKQNGEGFRERNAPPIDASGALKSGRSFKDLNGFKAALLAEKDRFTRAFTEKMLTYAIGRPVGYVDHPVVDAIAKKLHSSGDRIQPLIQAIVASETFQTK